MIYLQMFFGLCKNLFKKKKNYIQVYIDTQ